MKDEKHGHDKHEHEIPPNLPEGAYRDESGVWRDKDGNPIGGGEPEGGEGG